MVFSGKNFAFDHMELVLLNTWSLCDWELSDSYSLSLECQFFWLCTLCLCCTRSTRIRLMLLLRRWWFKWTSNMQCWMRQFFRRSHGAHSQARSSNELLAAFSALVLPVAGFVWLLSSLDRMAINLSLNYSFTLDYTCEPVCRCLWKSVRNVMPLSFFWICFLAISCHFAAVTLHVTVGPQCALTRCRLTVLTFWLGFRYGTKNFKF